MKIRTLIAGLVALGIAGSACAATWTNDEADGDINNAANWSGGLPSDLGTIGAVIAGTPLTINQVFNNGGDNRSEYLITGPGGLTVADGGSFTYLGDGLYGSSIAGGASTITHTGGTLTQDGGGNGFLIGHNALGTYNISGGNLRVLPNALALVVDFSTSDGSSLTISGTGEVEVGTGVNLVINAGGTLNVTEFGRLIWRNRLVSEFVPTGTVNVPYITQIGNDVHFTAFVVPEPSTLALAVLGVICLALRRRG